MFPESFVGADSLLGLVVSSKELADRILGKFAQKNELPCMV